MSGELTRLQSAIAAIHNHLHAGDVNAAHEACECAMNSDMAVSQPNLSVPDSARIASFASNFNALCLRYRVSSAFVAMLPSATDPRRVSLQIGGQVDVCKMVESAFNGKSTYQGEH